MGPAVHRGSVANPAVVVGSRVKTITNTGFVATPVDPQTGDVLTHHGGAYTFDGTLGRRYHRVCQCREYNSRRQNVSIKIEVDGDTWRHVGVGNRWTEVWKRLMATE